MSYGIFQTFDRKRFERESAAERKSITSELPQPVPQNAGRAYDIAHTAGIPIEAGRFLAALEARVTELERELQAFKDQSGRPGWIKGVETRRS